MILWFFFFFKQKTAYEMRISDWSSDVCSSDLDRVALRARYAARADRPARRRRGRGYGEQSAPAHPAGDRGARADLRQIGADPRHARRPAGRSEEHTSELQSLMRISYAVFCLKQKKYQTQGTYEKK